MDFSYLDNKVVLITGGTGSFGKAFTRLAMRYGNLKKLIILSRDEMKQWDMQNQIKDERL